MTASEYPYVYKPYMTPFTVFRTQFLFHKGHIFARTPMLKLCPRYIGKSWETFVQRDEEDITFLHSKAQKGKEINTSFLFQRAFKLESNCNLSPPSVRVRDTHRLTHPIAFYGRCFMVKLSGFLHQALGKHFEGKNDYTKSFVQFLGFLLFLIKESLNF